MQSTSPLHAVGTLTMGSAGSRRITKADPTMNVETATAAAELKVGISF
jgi:hypothetical protein